MKRKNQTESKNCLKKKIAIGVRLNPDINAATHKKISTGKAEDKFGLSKTNLISFCLNIKKFKNLKLNAISVHIGSQILSENPFKKTLKVLEEIINKTRPYMETTVFGKGHAGRPLCCDPMIQHIILPQMGLPRKRKTPSGKHHAGRPPCSDPTTGGHGRPCTNKHWFLQHFDPYMKKC